MFTGYNDDAYPILGGKALVKVNLRTKESRSNFYSKIIKRIKYSFVRMNTGSLFVHPMGEQISMVRLERSTDKDLKYRCKSYEYNLMKDAVNPWQKIRLVAGGAVAAGILMLSTFGLLGKGSLGSNQNLKTSIGINLSDNEQKSSSDRNLYDTFVVSMTDKENVIMASLSYPMDPSVLPRIDGKTLGSYPFKSRTLGEHTNYYAGTHSDTTSGGTHTNIPSSVGGTHTNLAPGAHSNTDGHSNISGVSGHTNIAPTPSHTDTGAGHTDTAHTNYGGHNNGVEHTNSYTDTP